jgi:Fe-S cluster biogenesis protein NfuA
MGKPFISKDGGDKEVKDVDFEEVKFKFLP